ncbi:LysR family transcriptional regulator [Pararhodospirillum photometricum]
MTSLKTISLAVVGDTLKNESSTMDYLAAMTAFVRTAALGSFSRAAGEMGLKVSTVSRYVAGLEADLGVALFNRSTRGLHLTEAGRLFQGRATRILADLEEARGQTTALNTTPRGVLRVNLPSAFGRRHVMPHMQDFLATYPDISLDAVLTDVTVDLIETATDVAVRIGSLEDSSLVARKLAPQHRVLVASPAYGAAHPALTRPDDLSQHACLSLSGQPSPTWYARAPGQAPCPIAIQGRLRTNDTDVLRDATLAGLGIALLPTWLVSGDLRAGRLISLLPAYEWTLGPDGIRSIWAVYVPKKVVSPKVRAFIAFLIDRFGTPPSWDL